MSTTTWTRSAAPAALALTAALVLTGCGDDDAVDEGQGTTLADVAVEGDTNDNAANEGDDNPITAREGGDQDEGEVDVAANLVGETVTVSGRVTEVISESVIVLSDGDSAVPVMNLDGPLADLGLEATPDLAEDQAEVEVTGTVQRYLLTELVEIAEVFGPGYEDASSLDAFDRENVIVVDSISLLED